MACGLIGSGWMAVAGLRVRKGALIKNVIEDRPKH